METEKVLVPKTFTKLTTEKEERRYIFKALTDITNVKHLYPVLQLQPWLKKQDVESAHAAADLGSPSCKFSAPAQKEISL